jgi:hypothetical protein
MRRIVLPDFGPAGDQDAARVLGSAGDVLAVVAQPVEPSDSGALRDAIIALVLDEDFGDIVLAGVAFAPHLGGDAVGFT